MLPPQIRVDEGTPAINRRFHASQRLLISGLVVGTCLSSYPGRELNLVQAANKLFFYVTCFFGMQFIMALPNILISSAVSFYYPFSMFCHPYAQVRHFVYLLIPSVSLPSIFSESVKRFQDFFFSICTRNLISLRETYLPVRIYVYM